MIALERTLHSIAVALDGAHFLSAWNAASGVLFVPTLNEARVGDEVAVRISIAGQRTVATVFGTVKLVRRRGRPSLPPGVEVVVDGASLPAAQFLALAARAGHVDFQERPPRYVVSREIAVRHGSRDVRCATRNVSDGGCAVAWKGRAPEPGEVLTLLLRHGIFSGAPRAVVCWTSADASSGSIVGLRVLGGGLAGRTWRTLVADAARTTGRTA